MGSELAPEFVLDQGLYYPADGSFYGYYLTGTEMPTEWDDQHRSGLDGQDLQYPAFQTASPALVHCPPTYEYVQSLYNPYNPYIPGAVMGVHGGPFIGNSHYLDESSFQQTVSRPAYIPVLVQSNSDMTPYTSTDPMFVSTAGGKYVPPLSSVSVTSSTLKASLQNPTFEPFRPSLQNAIRPLDGSLMNTVPSSHVAFTSGVAPYMTQATDHSFPGNVQPICAPVKIAMPANNGFTNLEPNANGCALGERIRPRAQLNGTSSRNLSDQNRGPRITRPPGQLASSIASRTYPTKDTIGNLNGNVIVHADQYNRVDFPLDYMNAKFFVIKSYSEDDVHKSIKYNVWSSTSSGNKRLDAAYVEAQYEKQRKCPVFLFFSVNASGQFCGVAEMIGPVDFHKDMDFWLQDKWTGSFPVKWHIVKDVPNSSFRHIILVNNEHRPVTSSRDTQEVPYLPGMSMLTIFKNSPITTSILDDYMYYEGRQKIMQEEKSRFLPRRTHQTPNYIYLPTPIKPDGTTDEPLRTDDVRQNNTIIQASVSEQKEPNVKVSSPEHSGKADHPTEEQQNVRNQLNPTSDGVQLNNGADQPRETSGKQIRKQIKQRLDSDGSGKLTSSQDNQVAMPRSVRDGGDESPAAVSSEGKTEETDVTELLTIGSMQIKVNKANSSFTGTLTLGSIPADMKGLKLK